MLWGMVPSRLVTANISCNFEFSYGNDQIHALNRFIIAINNFFCLFCSLFSFSDMF